MICCVCNNIKFAYICKCKKSMKNMKKDVIVEITAMFDKEEKTLSKDDRVEITKSLNQLVSITRIESFPRKLYRTNHVIFPKSINRKDSTLYMFKANKRYVVILSLDNDEIFNQKILCLYRIVHINESSNVFNEVASLLYK